MSNPRVTPRRIRRTVNFFSPEISIGRARRARYLESTRLTSFFFLRKRDVGAHRLSRRIRREGTYGRLRGYYAEIAIIAAVDPAGERIPSRSARNTFSAIKLAFPPCCRAFTVRPSDLVACVRASHTRARARARMCACTPASRGPRDGSAVHTEIGEIMKRSRA